MSTITVGGVEEKLPAFVADMVQNAACVDSRRMEMQVCEEMLPLILEDAVEQVESPMTSSDVEDERLELHCRVVREGEVADATVRAGGRQTAASSNGHEVDGDVGEASPALSPHVVDLGVYSSTKLTPEQVVQLEKWLMEHEDVFSRDAQDLGCTSLVQASNMTDSPPMKQPHSSVPLAKREEMRLPLDLATRRTPEKELPQTAHELLVTLQQQMEATWRQVSNNRRLARQAMTRWYQLPDGDAKVCGGRSRLVVQSQQEMRHHSEETGELLGTWEGRTPFCNDSQLSPTCWTLAQAGGGASPVDCCGERILHVGSVGNTLVARQ
ncbi:hypothetical protein E2C01_041084 [Portunus trituberculatus]|uniref:Uncharacterized protein n=1 Tax=Portunus trituberculatus TaxID=210409 RepID=A0A5B7FLH7_PORTR|nr:hypothetical protein [Portunus trituberculatus]